MDGKDNYSGTFDLEVMDVAENKEESDEKNQESESSEYSESSDEFDTNESDYNEDVIDLTENKQESSESSSEFEFESESDSSAVKLDEESKQNPNDVDLNGFLQNLETTNNNAKASTTNVIYTRYQQLGGRLPGSTKLTKIEEVLFQPCCGELCCLKFTPEFVMRARLKIPTSKPENVHYFQFFSIQNCISISGNFSPKINEIPICDEFFRRLYVIPKTRFNRFIEQIAQGLTEPLPHGNTGTHRENQSTSLRTAQILCKMDNLVEPNPADSSYLMATGTTKSDAIKYCELNTKIKINPTQEFKRVKTKFRWHKTHAHKRCRICTRLKKAQRDPANSPTVQKEAGQHLKNHQNNIIADNRDYFLRKTESNEQPKFLLSIAHDGMSKNKTKFPHLNKGNTKKMSDPMQMMCSLNIGLAHRKTLETSYQLHCFWNIDQMFGAGANSIVSQLYFTISHCDPIPPNIAIQLDNCASNKCYTLFGSMGLLLIYIPQLTNIYICTSEVGHTHNDVDQKFGILARSLKNDEVYTPQGYIRYSNEKLKGLITNNLLPTTYDFDSFIRENVIENGLISKNHYFELSKLENNTVTMKIARFLRSEKFLSNTTGTQTAQPLFKVQPNISEYPAIIPPKKIDEKKFKTLCLAIKDDLTEMDYQELQGLPEFIEKNYQPEPFKDLLDRISAKVVAQDINVSIPEDTENEIIEEFFKRTEKKWDPKKPESSEVPSAAKPKNTATKRKQPQKKVSSKKSKQQ